MSNSFSAGRGLSFGLAVLAISASAIAGSNGGPVITRLVPVKSPPLVVPAPEPPLVVKVEKPEMECRMVVTREVRDSSAYSTYVSPLQVQTSCAGTLFAAGVYSVVPSQPVVHISFNICPSGVTP